MFLWLRQHRVKEWVFFTLLWISSHIVSINIPFHILNQVLVCWLSVTLPPYRCWSRVGPAPAVLSCSRFWATKELCPCSKLSRTGSHIHWSDFVTVQVCTQPVSSLNPNSKVQIMESQKQVGSVVVLVLISAEWWHKGRDRIKALSEWWSGRTGGTKAVILIYQPRMKAEEKYWFIFEHC